MLWDKFFYSYINYFYLFMTFFLRRTIADIVLLYSYLATSLKDWYVIYAL